MRTLTRRVAALAIVSTLTLAGCGGGDGESDDAAESDTTTSAPETTDAPDDDTDIDAADGTSVKGDGYSYSVPEGWEVPTQDIPGTEQTDSFAADLTDDDGFTDNINVIRLDPAPVKDLDDLEDALVKELEGAGSKDVTARDRLDVDGDEAVHIASALSQQGSTYLAEQYNPIHDGVSYVVTFSFSDTVSEADRDALAESVLATWKWAS